MSWIKPWPADATERRELENSLLGLRGEKITEVRYLNPSSSEDSSLGSHPDLHEVSMGIELEISRSSLFVVAWQMQGACEGLAFGLFPTTTYERRPRLSSFDVGSAGPWRTRMGGMISEVGVAWHIPDDACPPTVWSIRFVLDSGDAVTFSLGEVDPDGWLRYQPDGILAIFDPDVAKTFRIPASKIPAWGIPLVGGECADET